MRVLLLGSGGREHALAASLVGSEGLETLFIAPGNSGTGTLGVNVALDASDHAAVIDFCKANEVGFVVIGPEAPLVAGLVDDLEFAGLQAFGPTRAAAQLEGSKGFTKDLCRDFGIPTAAYRRVSSREEAEAALAAFGAPIVVKADGLAAGKGVTVATTMEEARRAVDAIFSGAFGDRAQAVIEEVLVGEEASFFAFCDGERALPFAAAQDHKRAFDGDRGPNTGGMGAYSPAPIMTEDMIRRTMREIVEPTLAGMKARGARFRGLLFAGLMIGVDGPKLIEFNVRFGDPEAEAILPRFQGDLLALMRACAQGRLDLAQEPRFSSQAALTVVLAAGGYPDAPQIGGRVTGLEQASAVEGVRIFHAGLGATAGGLVARGGRVLTVTGLDDTLLKARERAYASIERIALEGSFYRKDIGWRALAK